MALTDPLTPLKPDDWKKLSFLPIKLCGSRSCSCANCPSATCVLQWPGIWRRKKSFRRIDGFPTRTKYVYPAVTLLSWYTMVTWCCQMMIYSLKTTCHSYSEVLAFEDVQWWRRMPPSGSLHSRPTRRNKWSSPVAQTVKEQNNPMCRHRKWKCQHYAGCRTTSEILEFPHIPTAASLNSCWSSIAKGISPRCSHGFMRAPDGPASDCWRLSTPLTQDGAIRFRVRVLSTPAPMGRS